MSNRRRLDPAHRAGRDAAMAGGVLLRPPATDPVILRPGGSGTKVRNVQTGRVLPCCWSDCQEDGNDRIQVQLPHDQPRWRDPKTGAQEMLVYIFCSDEHKAFWFDQVRQAT